MELHSRRRIGRPGTGSLICSLDLVHRGVEPLCQFFGDIFPQSRMPSLDGSQSGRGHSNLLGQLRLRQTSKTLRSPRYLSFRGMSTTSSMVIPRTLTTRAR